MTDNPTVGTPEAGGAADANQTVSPTPAAPIDGGVTQTLTELGGRLESLTKELRGLQSRQDKGEKNQASFQEQLARYQQFVDRGLKPDEAIAEMQRVDSFASWQAEISKQISDLAGRLGGIGNTPAEQQFVAKALAEFNLDPKDPYVASQMQGQQFRSELEAQAWAGRVLRDKINAPNPNQAQSASSPGTSAAPANTDALFARWQELSKNYTVNRAEIETVEKELKAAGAMR